MKLTLVLARGRLAELMDPEEFAGRPLHDVPGSSGKPVGTILRAWREGDELRAEVEVRDEYAELLQDPVGFISGET